MKRQSQHEYRERIASEAAEWFALMQDPEHSMEDKADFAEWLKASKVHVHEYLETMALWSDFTELGPDQDIDAVISLANREGENIVPLFGLADTPAVEVKRFSRKAAWYPIAASLAGIAVALLLLFPSTEPVNYRTAVGEQGSYQLPDGSTAILNAKSEIEVRYNSRYRDILLVSGEVLLDVAKKPDHPFRVITGDAVVQVLGTRFNVRHRHIDTTVTVVDGAVQVQPAELSVGVKPVIITAGQQANVDTRTYSIAVAEVDANDVMAWRERRLVFDSKPLSAVIDEFNLYNHPPLLIADPGLETLKVSGAFNVDDWQSFVLYLEAMNLATVRKDQNGRVTLWQKRESVK